MLVYLQFELSKLSHKIQISECYSCGYATLPRNRAAPKKERISYFDARPGSRDGCAVRCFARTTYISRAARVLVGICP